MKMSEFFELPLFAKNHEVGSRCSIYEGLGVTVASSFYANQLQSYEAICKAVNSHDRLTSENARLRDSLRDAMCVIRACEMHETDNTQKIKQLKNSHESIMAVLTELEKGDE